MKKKPFKVGDRVRIITAAKRAGPTLWQITWIGPNGLDCFIKEVSDRFDYAPQRWDTSMLMLADSLAEIVR